jgi:hypothetical protein
MLGSGAPPCIAVVKPPEDTQRWSVLFTDMQFSIRPTAAFAEMTCAMRSVSSNPVTDGGVPELFDG